MNYTKPEEENHQDDPKDWLGSAMVFAKALGNTLPPNSGIVVELENDMLPIFEPLKMVLVSNVGGRINIEAVENDTWEDGDFVKISSDEDE